MALHPHTIMGGMARLWVEKSLGIWVHVSCTINNNNNHSLVISLITITVVSVSVLYAARLYCEPSL